MSATAIPNPAPAAPGHAGAPPGPLDGLKVPVVTVADPAEPAAAGPSADALTRTIVAAAVSSADALTRAIVAAERIRRIAKHPEREPAWPEIKAKLEWGLSNAWRRARTARHRYAAALRARDLYARLPMDSLGAIEALNDADQALVRHWSDWLAADAQWRSIAVLLGRGHDPRLEIDPPRAIPEPPETA